MLYYAIISVEYSTARKAVTTEVIVPASPWLIFIFIAPHTPTTIAFTMARGHKGSPRPSITSTYPPPPRFICWIFNACRGFSTPAPRRLFFSGFSLITLCSLRASEEEKIYIHVSVTENRTTTFRQQARWCHQSYTTGVKRPYYGATTTIAQQ